MKLVFISDLHLSPNTFENNQLFFSLLNKWENSIDALYILGDFFDYWVGDDDDNAFIAEIKAGFSKFTKNTPIYFLGGNHDFAVGKQFAKDTGIQLIKDCTVIKHQDKKILLSHGDIFCSLDIGYQRMKKVLQNPILVYILRKIPLKWRYAIKNKLEKESNSTYNQIKPEKYKIVDSTITKYMLKYSANIVIHGHTHDPGHYKVNLSNGYYADRFEIPDWVGSPAGGYVLFNDNKIEILI